MTTINVKVTGLVELQKAINELPKELQRGPLRSAVSAAAKVVQDEAKKNVQANPSIDTGDLLKSIYRTRSRSGSNHERETHIVGVRSGRRKSDKAKGVGAPHWWHVEFGTKNMAAEPFLRPAFDNTKQQVIAKLTERLKTAIARAAAKVKGK